ncbi:MAG: hypothetical protein AAB425_08245, partial [Bdellovibrionota bacterium]
GDMVEIFVTGHGNVECSSGTGQKGTLKTQSAASGAVPASPSTGPSTSDSESDTAEKCEHVFGVFDATGNEFSYPTSKIIAYLARLEAKGALPNLVMDSCHSGEIKPHLSGLKKTCVAMSGHGDSVSYGCFESDPDTLVDYTSSIEYVAMRYYAGILDSLAADPYLQNSRCFQKTTQHAQAQKVKLGTIEDAYWSSRPWDLAFHEPSLNTMVDSQYFTVGHFGAVFENRNDLLCIADVTIGLEEIIAQVRKNARAVLDTAKGQIVEAVESYNRSIEAQRAWRTRYPDQLSRLAELQAETNRLARFVVQREREFMAEVRRLDGDFQDEREDRACARRL